ncbi:MAG: hypothetical protein ACXABJ_11055 [Candidatus Heimdallarchaeaceae archaeon]|jgi:flagellar motor switch protein FliM
MKEIEILKEKSKILNKKKVDTYDIDLELRLAKDKISTGQMKMAENYLESVRSRIKEMGKKE